jgi:hypothetical protein
MHTPAVTEIARASAHHRQVELVRASLLRGVAVTSSKPSSPR